VEFQTVNPIPLPQTGRFLDFSVNVAAVNCAVSAPLLQFSLTNGGTATPVGGQINGCSSGKTVNAPASGPVPAEPISVGTYTSNGSVLFTGASFGLSMTNANGSGIGNDHTFDDIKVLDVTPQLDKSFSPTTLTAGQTSKLTFTITNTSELAAKNGWSFTDHLPSGLTIANPAGPSTTCSSGTLTATAGGTSIAVGGNLDAGQASCAATVNVTSSTIGSYTNGPANVTGTGVTPPGSSTVTFQGADLQVTKSASPGTGVPGTDETYMLVAKNNGPATASSATVSDPLPSNLTFVSATSGCTYASGTVRCTAGDMASGATKTFTVVAKIASSDTARITNTATIASPTPDPNPGNNTSTTTTPVGPKADLQLTKTASTASVVAGGQVMYTLVVNNNGPSDDTNVTVTDSLPAGFSLVSAQPSQGQCSPGTSVSCNLGTIVDGGSAQILVTANVATSAAGSITNTASVIGDHPDPTPGNNTGTSTITVPPPPAGAQPVSDLVMVKTANHRAALLGQQLTYTLTVTNHGPDTAGGVKITDTASLSLKVLSAKPSQGTCQVGRPITCSLGALAHGAKATITVTAEVTQTGTEANTASTTSASRDPNPTNNIDSAHTKITALLRLRKTATPRTVQAGGAVTYHLALTNPNGATVRGVKVCDRLPLGLVYVSSSPRAKVSKGSACWTVRSLHAHASKTITLHARALSGTSGNLTNHATATAKGVRTARASSRVHVIAAPKPATPVTG
jgi:uncharacterized repeat protein (TIGR01451 family)